MMIRLVFVAQIASKHLAADRIAQSSLDNLVDTLVSKLFDGACKSWPAAHTNQKSTATAQLRARNLVESHRIPYPRPQFSIPCCVFPVPHPRARSFRCRVTVPNLRSRAPHSQLPVLHAYGEFSDLTQPWETLEQKTQWVQELAESAKAKTWTQVFEAQLQAAAAGTAFGNANRTVEAVAGGKGSSEGATAELASAQVAVAAAKAAVAEAFTQVAAAETALSDIKAIATERADAVSAEATAEAATATAAVILGMGAKAEIQEAAEAIRVAEAAAETAAMQAATARAKAEAAAARAKAAADRLLMKKQQLD
eukprot:gnl/MRDRNA2_/MRDRNA2_30182_c0_seq1.p1 gnl/MRDRNA2_/MRDRNA2_30182_c0~~gnl/MRDRNA2_/MRDRNA2_30182_c0_seq1.p1  ORF type:complete len:310 (-),score=77.96 gnl/MRDRNA2_/MRDRNA2_30182_c0_seq1:266-1195(-)